MQRQRLEFRHETIDRSPPSDRLTFCQPVDLTGNGRMDVIVGGKGADENLSLFGLGTRLPNYRRRVKDVVGEQEVNLFWYENTGEDWIRHEMAETGQLEVGATLTDVDGDGQVDLVAGRTIGYPEVYWFRQPEDPRRTWRRRLVTDQFDMYHDLAVGDVDDDGDLELVGLSQAAETVFYYDVPDTPTVEPWPRDHCTVVAEDFRTEGIAIVDIDGDGRTELLAGTSIFHRSDDVGSTWRREQVLEDWDDVRIAVADLDGDESLEIVYAEGDSPAHGSRPGRVAWVDPNGSGEATLLREEMFCPHSLDVADFTGDGRPDVFVGEMGLGRHSDPELVLFLNRGGGEFEEQVVARGTPTHEAVAVDVDGDGRTDIVGKSFTSDPTVDVWYNER